MLIYGPLPRATYPATRPEDRCACGHTRVAHQSDDLTFTPRLGPCMPEREVATDVDCDSPCACTRFRPMRARQ